MSEQDQAWAVRLRWGKAFVEWFESDALPLLRKHCAPQFLEQIVAQAGSLKHSLQVEHRTEVAFLGTTTVGKSTTINAVLGRRLLPENRIGSTTAAKVLLQFAETESLTVAYVSREWLEQEFHALQTDWREAIEEESLTGQAPEGEVATSIERRRSIVRNALGLPNNHQMRIEDVDLARVPPDIRERLGTKRDFVDDITARLAEHVAGRFAALVDQATLSLPDPTLSDGLAIVDLPGTGDADEGRIRALRQYIDRAEQVVLVLSIQLMTTDVQSIFVSSDLLTRLQTHKRPLVVVGTKIDTANPPTPDLLNQHGLLGTLSGLRATEAIWQAKAEEEVFKLLSRHVDKSHPRASDESLEDYGARVRSQFGPCAILPINPRASLELDSATRSSHTSAEEIASWKSQYPQPGDTGIDELCKRLRAIAITGRTDARQRLSRELEQLYTTVTSILQSPVLPSGEQKDIRALEKGLLEVHEAANSILRRADVELEALRLETINKIHSVIQSAMDESEDKRSAQVKAHLRAVHVSSVKASVRDPRNGVWNRIHVPNALLDPTRQRALEVWRGLESELQSLSVSLVNSCGDYASSVERVLRQGLQESAVVPLAALQGHKSTLTARLESGIQELAAELRRMTGPLTDQTELLARRRLKPVAAIAAGNSGPGTKDKIINELAGSAAVVTNDVLPQADAAFLEATNAAVQHFMRLVLGVARTATQAVAKDMLLSLRATPSPQVDAAAVAALARLPEQKHPEAAGEAHSSTPSMPAFAPFLVGTTIPARAKAFWDPGSTTHPLNNFGLLLSGDSGSGKTQLIKALVAHLADSKVPTWIFDFKNDFADAEFTSTLGLDVVNVSRQGLPFNPLALSVIAGREVQPIRHIHEITHCLERIYKLGVRQAGRLRKALVRVYEDRGIDPLQHFSTVPTRQPAFEDVRQVLAQNETDNEGLLNRLSPLLDFGLFPSDDAIRLNEMLGRSVVFSLHDLPNDRIKLALAEFMIMRLHSIVLQGEQPRQLRRMLVFDEAWRIGANERLIELGREGRAFGVGILVSSQFPNDVPESLRGNLATKLYLANTDTKHRSVLAKQLGLQTEDTDLVSLAKHEGYLQSAHFSPAEKVRTTPYFERVKALAPVA